MVLPAFPGLLPKGGLREDHFGSAVDLIPLNGTKIKGPKEVKILNEVPLHWQSMWLGDTDARAVLIKVQGALCQGDISAAKKIYNEAQEEGVFLAELGVSYNTWRKTSDDATTIQLQIEELLSQYKEKW